jgi:hypothetical protein
VGGHIRRAAPGERKRSFRAILCIKTNILPRQARDKHRESTLKNRLPFSLRMSLASRVTCLCICLRRQSRPSRGVRGTHSGRRTVIRLVLYTASTLSDHQDRRHRHLHRCQ